MTAEAPALGPSLEKVRAAHRALGEAIGTLEMARSPDDRDLVTGYSGTAAVRHLREAKKQSEVAVRLLEALGPR